MLSIVKHTEAPENLRYCWYVFYILRKALILRFRHGGGRNQNVGKMDAIIYGRTLFACVRLGFSQEDCAKLALPPCTQRV